jgi:alanyl-tRNA synthetase
MTSAHPTSPKLTSADIRRAYIDFFVQKHGHTFVPSSPVVPHDDPTLLFTNAGMNQFKPIFLGSEKRAYSRAVNTQKCIRAGGKHNDLDDVGRSRRHHTFFEMLGNWSFGDYFKQGAIEMSWELLTKVWKLDPRRLHVTCFEGDEKNGVPRDTESAGIWKQVANWEALGLKSEDHIHYFGKDNFWEMGETGPCGPCTEIYVDRRPMEEIEAERKAGGRAPVNTEETRIMEIWNNVFIQYNRNPDRSLTVLPAQHVDTGMGFERITQVLQDVGSNYDIDLFNPFWAKLKELSGFDYTGSFPKTNAADPAAEAANPQLRRDIAFRVIADHIRCLTFALTDGAQPSNEGRGYVLRRILRRAVRFGRQTLELREPFLFKLVDVVVGAMGDAFPELKKNPKHVADLIQDEEVSFIRTLDRGIALFDEAAHGKRQIAAEDAFKLHDTFGFPIDLTRIMAEERGMSVDIAGYERLMEEAKDKARAGGKGEASPVTNLPPAALDTLAKSGIQPTDDKAKFGGVAVQAKVAAIWDGKELVQQAGTDEVAVLLDKTSFYAEMGGQVGDGGTLSTPAGTFNVETTKVVGGYVLHIGKGATLKVGEAVTAAVGKGRAPTQQNHSTTHLANWALREVLGEGVQQKGSLVDASKLRFDFSHNKAVEVAELAKVEELVNAAIAKDLKVHAKEVPQEQALKINGLRAVFGEKYPPLVRVVSVGPSVDELLADPASDKWRGFSVEFCGGTHLASVGEAKAFVIVEESSVSKGIRRIVGLTGGAARAAQMRANEIEMLVAEAKAAGVDKLAEMIGKINSAIAAAGSNLPLVAKRAAQAAVVEVQARIKAAEKAAKASGAGLDVAAEAEKLLASALDFGGGKVVVAEVPGASDDELRRITDSLKKRSPAYGALLLSSPAENRVTVIASVSDDLVAKGLKAGDWAGAAAVIVGGRGGGKPTHAQAGGKDVAKIGEAVAAGREFVKRLG